MAFEAKIIKDSICNGQRLTTMQVTHPRIIHAEFNTHCMFARNASSSRAIPFHKMVQKVIDDPFIPLRFPINQPGMQGFSYLSGLPYDKAVNLWLKARDQAVDIAYMMSNQACRNCSGKGYTEDHDYQSGTSQYTCVQCEGTGKGLGVHKQIVNRLLEAWMWITVCVTGDKGAWMNYFALRSHKDAEDHIAHPSFDCQEWWFENKPDELQWGEWHLPYLDSQEVKLLNPAGGLVATVGSNLVEVSVGRCARTSYLTQEGKRDFIADVELCNRLTTHKPMHASPLEHVCVAKGDGERYGKYIGWRAYRHMLPNEYVTEFQPNYKERHI